MIIWKEERAWKLKEKLGGNLRGTCAQLRTGLRREPSMDNMLMFCLRDDGT